MKTFFKHLQQLFSKSTIFYIMWCNLLVISRFTKMIIATSTAPGHNASSGCGLKASCNQIQKIRIGYYYATHVFTWKAERQWLTVQRYKGWAAGATEQNLVDHQRAQKQWIIWGRWCRHSEYYQSCKPFENCIRDSKRLLQYFDVLKDYNYYVHNYLVIFRHKYTC